MIIADVSTAPWPKIGIDLSDFKGKDYLVTDHYADFHKIAFLSNTCMAYQSQW